MLNDIFFDRKKILQCIVCINSEIHKTDSNYNLVLRAQNGKWNNKFTPNVINFNEVYVHAAIYLNNKYN